VRGGAESDAFWGLIFFAKKSNPKKASLSKKA
jgi:hypothetical protein